ncbi:hypothetical protein M413DRAFT_344744 [Hebeloma cylindrosporum]|uniref:Uncharacterized protein n=1 Tax=Hebeloma cylindrosporum TaxID=76867 RepID=A0A0C3CA06_HEBCY|nr:hypothetical protein M413DRAFT_344744 [Hebeloma cylindrosporum h7]
MKRQEGPQVNGKDRSKRKRRSRLKNEREWGRGRILKVRNNNNKIVHTPEAAREEREPDSQTTHSPLSSVSPMIAGNGHRLPRSK